MSVATKLAGFGVLLLVVFGAAFGVGRAVGDGEPASRPATTTTTAPGHGGHP